MNDEKRQQPRRSGCDFQDNTFINCQTAVHVVGDWDVTAKGNRLLNVKRGFVIERIPRKLLGLAGAPILVALGTNVGAAVIAHWLGFS